VVARLAWLKSRLLWNGLRKDWQRRIGFPSLLALLGWVSWFLVGEFRATMATLGTDARLEFTLWGALLFWLVWVALPVVIFPLDENLDPAQFSFAPIKPGQLVAGLAISALIAPSVVIPLIVLGASVVEFAAVLPAALLSALLLLAIVILSGQVFTTVISAVFKTRHGRDLALLIVLGIGLSGFIGQGMIREAIGRLGLEGALLATRLDGLAALLPPVAAQRVVVAAETGSVLGVVGWAVVSLAWIAVLGWMWQRLLGWMLTTPNASPARTRSRGKRGLAGAGGWSAARVIARKEWRFYIRDPRQRLVWTGAVIFIALAVTSVLVGTGGFGLLSSREWLPLLAPALVLFVGLPIALNVFGWERNAASFLFVLPVRPRTLLWGKNLAASGALVLETVALAILLAWVSGGWSSLVLVPGLMVAAIGCQLAVGNIVSVISPLRLPREGTDVFAQASEQGCLAIGAQAVSFFVIGLLLVIPSSVAVLTTSAFAAQIPTWFGNLFAVVWGLIFYGISLVVAASILRRRTPEVVSWVQTV
jgi:ABC-2 type transport system permease protein